jgi:2-hydroxycyclohexanecarboxyl-CoA dehydrogenase
MDLGLKGRTAIVTGGGSNIGRAITLSFIREGVNVAVADIDEQQGQKVVDQANGLTTGARCILAKTDVTSYASVDQSVKKTLAEFNGVDILVNSVGWDAITSFLDTPMPVIEKIVALNLWAAVNCVKAVLPHMAERRSGSIVSIGSEAGRMGEFNEAVYAACKAGVMAMSKSIAREVGPLGIRLNVVSPATTPPKIDEIGAMSMWKPGQSRIFTPEFQDKAAKKYPLRRLGTPQEVANAVLFLASDAASYITGQTLSVSGGYTMM